MTTSQIREFPALLERRAGTLKIYADSIEFVFDQAHVDAPIVIPLNALEVETGGENKPHFFLSHRLKKEPKICVQDLEAVKQLAKLGVQSSTTALRSSQLKLGRSLLIFSAPFLIGLLLILGLPLFISNIPSSWLQTLISAENEQKIGNWVASNIENLESSSPLIDPLMTLVTELQKSNAEIQNLTFRIYISKSSVPNAAAFPGGNLLATHGLIREAQSIEEIIGVLGHEIGHAYARHPLRALTGSLGSLGGFVLIGLLTNYEIAHTITQGSQLIDLHYSRSDEFEADQLSFLFLKNAHIATDGIIDFFKRDQKRTKLTSSPAKAFALLSTHPVSTDRIAQLQQLKTEHPFTARSEFPVTLAELKSLVP